jgi:hypothetical protein
MSSSDQNENKAIAHITTIECGPSNDQENSTQNVIRIPSNVEYYKRLLECIIVNTANHVRYVTCNILERFTGV